MGFRTATRPTGVTEREFSMRITFIGAVRTVTGSQHLLEINGKTIMLDCGLFQGKRKESFEKNRSEFCQGASIDCLILSHAHIDHSGRIPCLVRNGFNGDIFSTSATRDLCAVMLMDSAFIQEKDVEFVNRRRQQQGQSLFEPLYTKADVARSMDQFVGLSYNRPHQLFPGISHVILLRKNRVYRGLICLPKRNMMVVFSRHRKPF